MVCRPCCVPITPEGGWCLGNSNQGVVSLTLGNETGGTVFVTEQSRTVNGGNGTGQVVFAYDWDTLVPGLTGLLTIDWDGPCNPSAQQGVLGPSILTVPGSLYLPGSPSSNRNCMKCYHLNMAFNRPVELFKMDLFDFDPGYFNRGGEWVFDIDPPYTGLVSTTTPGLEQTTTPNTANRPACALGRLPDQGPGIGVVKGVGTTVLNQSGHIAWDGVFTQELDWSWNIPDRLNVTQETVEIAERGIAVSGERCDGEMRWTRSATGVPLTPEEIDALVRCRESGGLDF